MSTTFLFGNLHRVATTILLNPQAHVSAVCYAFWRWESCERTQISWRNKILPNI